MKTRYAFLLVCFLLPSLTVLSQSTNQEPLSLTAGSLIKAEYYDLEPVGRASLTIVSLTNLVTAKQQKLLRIRYQRTEKHSVKTAHLDMETVAEVVKAIEPIRTKIITQIPEVYTEVSYESKEDFSLGCFWFNNRWKIYLQLVEGDQYATVSLNRDQLNEFYERLGEVEDF